MTRVQRECGASIGQAVLGITGVLRAVDVAEIETVAEGLGRACQLQDTTTLGEAVAVAHTLLRAIVGNPASRNATAFLELRL